MVRVEVPVLAGEQRLQQVRGHLVDGDQLPLLVAEELGDRPVVDVEDAGRQRGIVLAEGLPALDRARGGQGEAEGDADGDRADEGDGEQDLEKGYFLPRRRGPG